MSPGPARYSLCPACARAVPVAAEERFCSYDGTPMLDGCPRCAKPILSPYALFCPACAAPYRAAPPEAP